jgi:anaerobic magnesium-protoporphyrin IX monomethyl ester cyclase
MTIMLVTPPQYDPTMPALAIPCLTAVLRDKGYHVVPKDANIEFFDSVLSKKGLENAYEKIKKMQVTFDFLDYRPNNMEQLISKKNFLIESVESAKKVLRSPTDFYNYEVYKNSFEILEDCLHFASLPYYETEVSFAELRMPYSSTSTIQILKSVRDELCNPYIDFYKNTTLKEINSLNPKIVGISINLQSQIIPGLTLAYMIKQTQKDIHIVVGGNYFSLLKENLKTNLKLFSFFDSIILNEGETAITKLVECLEKGLSLQNVPNLIYKEGTKIIANELTHIEDINKLPTPCFEGLPLDLYLSPSVILPIYMTRGCYWSKCAFCSLCLSNGAKYRIRNPEKLKRDMKILKAYGCSTFMFIDEAVPPKDMENLCDEIQSSNMDFNWAVHARFEKQFDARLCKKLLNAGCKFLKFGLESANKRILSLMDKGININNVKDVLSNSNSAGLINIISVFFGFPTETLDEAKETIKFVLDNINNINFIGSNNFMLFRNTKVYLNPEKYEIKEIFHTSRDLAVCYKHKTDSGMIEKEVINVYYSFLNVIKELTPWFMNIFHICLYSTHYQSNDLLWVTASREERLMGQDTFTEKKIANAKRMLLDLC